MTSYHIKHRFLHLAVTKFVVAEVVSFVKDVFVAFVMILLKVLLYVTVELYNDLLLVAVVPVVAVVVADVFDVGRNTTLGVAFVAVVNGVGRNATLGVAFIAVVTGFDVNVTVVVAVVVFRVFSVFVTVNFVS